MLSFASHPVSGKNAHQMLRWIIMNSTSCTITLIISIPALKRFAKKNHFSDLKKGEDSFSQKNDDNLCERIQILIKLPLPDEQNWSYNQKEKRTNDWNDIEYHCNNTADDQENQI